MGSISQWQEGKQREVAAGGGSGTDRAGERAGGWQLQAPGLGSVLPLQPERQERPHTRKFRVPLHSPIPINIVWPQEPRPPRSPGSEGSRRCQSRSCRCLSWWQMRSGDETRSHRGRFTLPLPSNSTCGWGFFFFRFAFKKRITILQLLAGVWVPWLRQDTDRKHTQSS